MPTWALQLPRRLLPLLCLAWMQVAPASAQAVPAPLCTVAGTVRIGDTGLPGVLVSLHSAEATPVTVSTNESGVWQASLAPGTYQVAFRLRGFVSEMDGTNRVACGGFLTTAMQVAGVEDVDDQDRDVPGRAGANAAGDPMARTFAVQGRQASLNRALLRERAAAVARGDIRLSPDPWPERLFTGRQGQPVTAPTPLASRLGTLPGTAPGIITSQVPRPVSIGATRLYSATASYTTASSVLDSTPYQLRADARQPKPDYFRQSVDFTVGGPLTIPGAFRSATGTNVTLSYSAIRGGNLFDQYATVPTPAMRAGDFSSRAVPIRDPRTGVPFDDGLIPSDRIDPAARALLSFFPLPNGSGDSRNFHYTTSNRSTQDTFNLRLTHALAGGDAQPNRGRGARAQSNGAVSATLNAQVEYRRNVNDRLSALPAIAGVGRTSNLRVPVSLNVNRRGTQQSVSLAYTRSTNITVNGYAGERDIAGEAGITGASTDPFAWGIPALSFASLTSVNDLTPSARTDERLVLGYAWSRGIRAHRVRLGVDTGHSNTASRTDQNARGAFVFTGLHSGLDVADFLLGLPQQASVQYGPGVVRLTGRTLSLYAQDDWRRWSNVTINAGLRYELVTPFTDPSGRLVNLDVAPGFTAVAPVSAGGVGAFSGSFPDALVRTDTNNLAPRIGAAWRIAARTTARVGYGVSFNTGGYATIARQLASQPPFAVTNTAIGSVDDPLSLASSLTGTAASTSNTFGVSRDYDAGVVRTWTLDVSRDMGDAWNVSGGMTRAAGTHLDILRAPNRGPDGLRLANVQPFLWQTSEGRSRLNSATLRIRRWYVRGLSTSMNYTFADSMDNASTIGGGATVVAQDEQNLAAEWGTSSFNRRHQLSGDLNFELPFGDNHRWLNRGGVVAALLGRWSAYVTFSAQSGAPLTARVLSNTTDVARGTNGSLRADLTGAPVALANPTVDRFFNTAAFSLPSSGTFGTSPRNLIRGPANRDISLQVTRDLVVGGRILSIQMRASNVFNLVNYASVDTVVNSPTFGQVLSVRPMRSVQLNLRWKL